MKNLFAILVLLTSTASFAHTGSHELACKSAKKSGARQPLKISLKRGNDAGLVAPTISATVNGKKYTLDTPDEMNLYGSTFHNSPLGVITITVNNRDDNTATVYGSFSVVAIPSTVRAFDHEGRPVKWNFRLEQDECSDAAGKAKFQGVIRGLIHSQKDEVDLDTQILDCELIYDSGMSC